jgi:hypothetical protein
MQFVMVDQVQVVAEKAGFYGLAGDRNKSSRKDSRSNNVLN